MGTRATRNLFEHRYYRINKTLLQSFGLWPYQSMRTRFACVALILLISVSAMAPQAIAAVNHRGDWDFVLECVASLTFDSFFITKFCFSVFNSKKMWSLLDRMHTDWDGLAWNRNIDFLHEYAEKGRKMTIVYGVTGFIICVISAIEPIASKIMDELLRNGTNPGGFIAPVDYLIIDEQKYYFYIFLHFCVGMFMAFAIIIAHDTLFIVYIYHGCGLYAVLGHTLEQMGKNTTLIEKYDITNLLDGPLMEFKDLASSIDRYNEAIEYQLGRIGNNQTSIKQYDIIDALGKNLMEFKDLASCIDRHNEAIEYAELIEATYSWCFFFMMGFNICLLTATGLQIVLTTSEQQRTLKLVGHNVCIMLHLYNECYMADILMEHSISIRNYILNSQWYSLPLKAQKCLRLMIMRCNVPCKITAGKVVIMTMDTFMVVLKTSLSYFTFLRSM